ncbi:coiled-coil domain-containing protein [Rhyzopertha dominica]|nr:coiled-coil domain-containing protein [Rhyzopertha dominica]
MVALSNCLEIVATDKVTGEEWECTYDATHVENLTHKTGNFKKFPIFVSMIKSGLLKTSDCVSLDLLTYEDLEMLRSQKLRRRQTRSSTNISCKNRKYLIVNYTVEFDKIHYPLPLDYCGPPDPLFLKSTIQKLQKELEKAKHQLACSDKLHKRQKGIANLEKSVMLERKTHHQLVKKLKTDVFNLTRQLNEVRASERILKNRFNKISSSGPDGLPRRDISMKTIYRRQTTPNIGKSEGIPLKLRSLSSPVRGERRQCPKIKTSRSSSLSRFSYTSDSDQEVIYTRTAKKTSSRSRSSSNCSIKETGSKRMSRSREPSLEDLQERIKSLQKMLQSPAEQNEFIG